MLKLSRVSSAMDTSRLGQALARPGMDTRTWVSLAIVERVIIDEDEGVFADVLLMPSGERFPARVAQEYAGNGFGLYTPIEVDDEVLVEAPSGDPDNGMILTRRLYSKSDPPPAEAASNPSDVLLVVKTDQTLRIITAGSGNVVIETRGAGKVKLGLESAVDPVVLKSDLLAWPYAGMAARQTAIAAEITVLTPGLPGTAAQIAALQAEAAMIAQLQATIPAGWPTCATKVDAV